MKVTRILLCLALGALLALPALAQGNPTARLSGKVVSADGAALPGATVTFESEALQGSRVVVTDGNGNYSSPPLPPGEYEVTFQLEGFGTQARRVRLGAAQNVNVEITLQLAEVTEEIVVSGEAVEVISEGTTSSKTITKEELEHLPVDRNLRNAVTLTAGVFTTGPNSGVVINGAQSWENLFLLNGVTLNENLRGQPFNLFIEDAIQETTTSTSGVSAEFGRFTGGVVNAITKSGGNQFSGSLRTSFDNDDWGDETELFNGQRTNEVNETFEATFGGPILRDRIWFFLAGRNRETEATGSSRILNLTFPTPNEEDRLEGKLTFSLTKSHQLQASYLEIEQLQGNSAHGGLTQFLITIDDGSLVDRELPQELQTFNYTGIITQNFFLEAQVSERQFSFEGSGGLDMSLNNGTPIWDFVNNVIYNESLFCGSCRPEERDNENQLLKASYFLSAGSGGSHDLVGGYDSFEDIRAADNHQSPNDLMIWNFAASIIDRTNNQVFPVFIGDGQTTNIEVLPILNETQGTSFITNSLFVNDRWRLNDHWSFNLGVRYDENDFDNSLGQAVIKSDEISPRLGATYRPSLESPWQFNASFGKYVGQLPNTVGNSSSPAGTPAQFEIGYAGPNVNTGGGPLLTSPQALDVLYNWLFGVCPNVLQNPFSCSQFFNAVDIPGATTAVGSGLASTSADEFTIGFTRQLGNRGTLRVDYVNRQWENFFATQRDRVTGIGQDSQGNEFDFGVVINEDNILEREYQGVNIQANYNLLNNRLRLGGTYTLSEAEGNFDGETSGSGPVTSAFFEYPELREARWAVPVGRLSIDQTHRLRAWAIFDIFRTDHHYLNVGLLQNFFSGTPFGASATTRSREFVDPAIVSQYVTPPATVPYFFTDRDAFETDDITATDLSLNYAFNVGRFEIFLQPEILNVLGEDGAVVVNTTDIARFANGGACSQSPTGRCLNFNPFTETPVEGVHFELGPNFGQPTADANFQTPRTYRFSVGFRF
jgi:hypothetical protein